MNEERIRQAIRVMEEVHNRRLPFNMKDWFAGSPYDCGTAACFGGWLTRDPWFQALGLNATQSIPTFEYYQGASAFAQLLDISYGQAEELTYPAYYSSDPEKITPYMVIEKLEELL